MTIVHARPGRGTKYALTLFSTAWFLGPDVVVPYAVFWLLRRDYHL